MKPTLGWIRAALCACVLIGATGCGAEQFKQVAQPPAPAQLGAVLTQQSVSLQPSTVGAGPTTVLVSNQSGSDQTLTFTGPGVSDRIPLHELQTATLQHTLSSGSYQLSATSAKQPATLTVGPARPSGSRDLRGP